MSLDLGKQGLTHVRKVLFQINFCSSHMVNQGSQILHLWYFQFTCSPIKEKILLRQVSFLISLCTLLTHML